MSKIPPRDGYGKALLKLAETNDKFIVLDGDVAMSTRTCWIRDKYPEKFVDIGISEQDMVGTAAGLALSGMVPFATTYCVFLAGRAWDQIRTAVAYGDANVKLAGAHAGINVGPDGASHQSMEDAELFLRDFAAGREGAEKTENYSVVAQTTFNKIKFSEIAEFLKKSIDNK